MVWMTGYCYPIVPAKIKALWSRFSLKKTGILFIVLQIYLHTYMHVYTGILPIALRSGERFLNGAPATLRFDQWKDFSAEWRLSVGTDPVVGSLCGRRKWKHKNIQHFVCVPRCLTSPALLIFTVSPRSSLKQAAAKVLRSHRGSLYLAYFFCLLMKNSVVHRLNS